MGYLIDYEKYIEFGGVVGHGGVVVHDSNANLAELACNGICRKVVVCTL